MTELAHLAEKTPERTDKRIVIVTGLSGAGKSTAMRVFEDMRYFCVDGLPASLVPMLVSLFLRQSSQAGQSELDKGADKGLAIGMDLRQHDFLDAWNKAMEELAILGYKPQVVFIESRPDVLTRRYATTRRPHPLESRNLGLEQAIEEERRLLMPIRRVADIILDTSSYSVHDLRRSLQEKWAWVEGKVRGLKVHIVSFGFKYGAPDEADLVFDMRFLPNPYFEEGLKPMSGKDEAVADYVLASDAGQQFMPRFLDFIHFLLPLYAGEGRYRLTIGIGCTGGRHRSVAVTETLAESIRQAGYVVTLEHRHIDLG